MKSVVPAVWDETIVLPVSQIGEIAAFARRSGDTWFLAILNGPAAKTVEIPLSFLGQGEYRAMLMRDDKDNDAALQIENETLNGKDMLSADLRAGGGFIARFWPASVARGLSPVTRAISDEQRPRHRAAWMKKARWGVMTHYLADWRAKVDNEKMSVENWNDMVDRFDVEGLARQVESVGAGYYLITIGQNSGYYLAPNTTYDRLVGIQPRPVREHTMGGEPDRAASL